MHPAVLEEPSTPPPPPAPPWHLGVGNGFVLDFRWVGLLMLRNVAVAAGAVGCVLLYQSLFMDPHPDHLVFLALFGWMVSFVCLSLFSQSCLNGEAPLLRVGSIPAAFVSSWRYGSLACWSLIEWFRCFFHVRAISLHTCRVLSNRCFGWWPQHYLDASSVFGGVSPHQMFASWW